MKNKITLFLLFGLIALPALSQEPHIERSAPTAVPEISGVLVDAQEITIRSCRDYRGCCSPVRIVEQAITEDVNNPQPILKNSDITDPELSSFTASPNPSDGRLMLTFDPELIGEQIQVLDMTGRIVGEASTIQSTSQQLEIVGPEGIYLLVIATETQKITKRILLQH